MSDTPTSEDVKRLINGLLAQHPNPWTRGAAYEAINPFTNEKVMIRKSTSVRDRIPFLHIYVKVTAVIKSPTGEILRRYPSQAHYRANLHTYEMVRID